MRDLRRRYAWDARWIRRFERAAGLVVGGVAWRSFAPPRVLVLVVPYIDQEMLRRAQPWIADAARVIVLRDRSEDAGLGEDPEVLAFHEAEWQEVLAEVSARDVFDWFADDTVCRDAMSCAIAACAELAAADVIESAAPVPPIRELPPSSWIAYEGDRGGHAMPYLAERIDARDGRVVLRTDGAGTPVDLAEPPASIRIAELGRPRSDAAIQRSGWRALGFDPIHRVGWNGVRMFFEWLYVGRSSMGFLSAADHDYPCGPAKKFQLRGGDNNEPVQIQLAPAADMCLARFENDVLITSAVPIAWHRAGDVDVAAFERDPQRALFYARDPESAAHAAEIGLFDEDARDCAPPVVLGPDASARYAIDLRDRVFRIMRPSIGDADAEIAHVGGPDEGYAVFDAAHRLVRRGEGRLLGGWFRWATIEDRGAYWREDLATGERVRLGPIDMNVCVDPEIEAIARDAIREGRYDDAAHIRASHPSRAVGAVDVLAIPGTRNVLLVAARFLRVL